MILACPGIEIGEGTALDRLFDPDLTIGTSTASSDPVGDYALSFLGDLARRYPTRSDPRQRIRELVGAPQERRSGEVGPVAAAMASGKVDLFVCYRTALPIVERLVLGVSSARVPESVAPRITYGLVRRQDAEPAAEMFVDWLGSETGQSLSADAGVLVPALIS